MNQPNPVNVKIPSTYFQTPSANYVMRRSVTVPAVRQVLKHLRIANLNASSVNRDSNLTSQDNPATALQKPNKSSTANVWTKRAVTGFYMPP